jgi:hypothetical protein
MLASKEVYTMEKPTIYIVVEGGLVQDVFVKAPWAADAEVVICDLDDVTVNDTAFVEKLPEIAHHAY